MGTLKIKPLDVIQSFDVTNPVDMSRGSYIGEVTKGEIDPALGIEFVYFNAVMRIRNGQVLETYKGKEMRAPQNGTPSLLGPTDGICVLSFNQELNCYIPLEPKKEDVPNE